MLCKRAAVSQGLQRWKAPSHAPLEGNTAPPGGVARCSSGSLVLAHLQILARQTQLWGRLLLQRGKDLASKGDSGGALAVSARIDCIHVITEAGAGLCKADVTETAHSVSAPPHGQQAVRQDGSKSLHFRTPAAAAARLSDPLINPGSLPRKGSLGLRPSGGLPWPVVPTLLL